MVLWRVLGERASEGSALLSSKMGLKHAGADLDAMAAIAQAAKKRSLDDFTAAVSAPPVQVLGQMSVSRSGLLVEGE